MRLATSVLSLILACASGCSGSDIKVVSIDDGAVAGELSPSRFGKYRNMVIGIDEVYGKVAVIEWGDQTSTLKIITLQPWQVSKRPVDAGRLTGIDGQMHFDFAKDCFIYATHGTITTISGKGEKHRYFMPTRKGYGITDCIMPTPEGLFLVTGTPYGDDKGLSLHKIAPDGGKIEEVFHTGGGVPDIGVYGKNVCLVERPKTTDDNPRLVEIDRATLAKVEHTLKSDDGLYAMGGGSLVSLSRDEKTLHRIPIASPTDAREFSVPPPKTGYLTYGLACSRDFALLTEGDNVNINRKVTVLDFRTGQTKEISINGYQARIKTLRCGGKDYAILSQ
jgi:hypothetical protein